MKWTKTTLMLVAFSLGCSALVSAEGTGAASSSSVVRLHRDPTFEQNLRYLASADTAVTPAKVLRWMGSLMGYTPVSAPSNIEFQPIVRAHDSQKQLIAQFAYKF